MKKLEFEECERLLGIVSLTSERLAKQMRTFEAIIDRNTPAPDPLLGELRGAAVEIG